ncbi:SDR family NAD(P)-dependent oxidoreductase [Rhodococcus koreensis]|uniref:SDR family NAD(P)-dependent oxidoreductase n=1 Tax=Rhodococcus koreensis TaxID=99653 RepID=UPI0036711A61
MQKRAIVTGGRGGIGAATVERLAGVGVEVHALDIDPEIQTAPPTGAAFGHVCDVTDGAQIERVCAAILADGPVSILVNCAAAIATGDAEVCSLDDYDKVMAVNVRGPWLLARQMLAGMREQGDGVIINLSSTAGIRPSRNRLAYSTSKAAIRQLTRSISTDFGQYGIRANTVCPGPIDTALWRASRPAGMSAEKHAEAAIEGLALKRLGTVDEIAAMIEFLVSDAASFVTGATIAADGGRTLH